MRPPSPQSAFSLIELLVAVAVATVVVGSARALILHSFDGWGQSMTQAGELRAADDFDADFGRDFASACPALGFQGTENLCVFWTLRPGADAPVLSRVRYVIGKSGLTAERWILGDDLEKPGLATRYPTKAFAAFSYGGTNITDGIWLKTWECPTNVPQAVSIHCATRHELPDRRLYIRSTVETFDR